MSSSVFTFVSISLRQPSITPPPAHTVFLFFCLCFYLFQSSSRSIFFNPLLVLFLSFSILFSFSFYSFLFPILFFLLFCLSTSRSVSISSLSFHPPLSTSFLSPSPSLPRHPPLPISPSPPPPPPPPCPLSSTHF